MADEGSSRSLTRQGLATLAYIGVVVAMAAAAIGLASDLAARSQALAAAQERLAQLEGRTPNGGPAPGARAGQPPGSPFLDGQSVTLAGAALQQRVGDAVAKAQGALLSSQIEIDGPQAKNGFVNLTANLEIAQSQLQELLYDLEAGMPYLYVERLDIHAPQAFGEAENARMRVMIAVAGQWRSN